MLLPFHGQPYPDTIKKLGIISFIFLLDMDRIPVSDSVPLKKIFESRFQHRIFFRHGQDSGFSLDPLKVGTVDL